MDSEKLKLQIGANIAAYRNVLCKLFRIPQIVWINIIAVIVKRHQHARLRELYHIHRLARDDIIMYFEGSCRR